MKGTSIAAGMAQTCGFYALARRYFRTHVRILAYHGVEDARDSIVDYDGFHVAPDVFRNQLEHLARHYRVLSLADVVRAWMEYRPIPEQAVVITFDDGYRNNLHVAIPLLQHYGLPATFYVTTGFIDGSHVPWWFDLRSSFAASQQASVFAPDGRPVPLDTPGRKREVLIDWERCLKDLREEERTLRLSSLKLALGTPEIFRPYEFMNWADVNQILKRGFEVGAHGTAHVSLGREAVANAVRDAAGSIQRLGQMADHRSTSFAFPYGRSRDGQPAVTQALRAEGILAALTTVNGVERDPADLLALRRLNVANAHDGVRFASLVSGFTGLIRGAC